MPKWMTTVGLGCVIGVLAVGIGLQQGVADDEQAGEDGGATPAREVDLKVISDPSHKKMNLTAPDSYKALFKTTQGEFTIKVTREWAPNGADRFYSLVKNGYYDGTRFFRVVEDFVVQWGIHGDPGVNKAWYDPKNEAVVNLKDDKRKKSNKAGTVTFANAGPNTRSTQLFVNLGDNDFLDNEARVGSIFAPFGEIDEAGMKVVRKLYKGYGEPPRQLQGMLAEQGNAVLDEYFPKMDGIKSATIVEDKAKEDAGE
ncbi:MAG: peptidylprolyl isomerase [Phycisphaeraceae bacterium]|nr:peptidylprolyl isomerase [Phycisphaeraceae bacterium]